MGGEAPSESDAVSEEDEVAETDDVCEGVGDGVGVLEPVTVSLVVAVTLILSLIEAVPEIESVSDELTSIESEHVGVPDIDCTRLCVELGVLDKVGVQVAVALAVGVLFINNVVVGLGEFVLRGVADGLDPRVADEDGVIESEALIVAVKDTV